MSFFIVCCVLSVILLVASVFYYILRLREIKLNIIGHLKSLTLILKIIIVPFSILLGTILFINTRFFTYTPESLATSLLVSLSMICIISSIILFIFSFQLSPKYIIELE